MHSSFWRKNPALLYGITLLIGTSSCIWLYPLWACYLIFLKRWEPIVFLVMAISYSFFLFSQIKSTNTAYFSPASLQPYHSPFNKSFLYKGMATLDGKQVPCLVHHPFTEDHPKANCDYILQGKLKKRSETQYSFIPNKWIRVENTWSLAELRFQLKESLKKLLGQKLHKPKVATFLASLLTGDVEDRALRYQFGKLGLQHILAISGFHFAILIAFCSFFLKLFLPSKWQILALLLAINLYFLFVGSLPAVQRSYLVALFFLLGKLLKRNSSALNLLGAALFIEVLLDPSISNHLGFQLSFLSCLGILVFRPLFFPLAYFLFPKHNPTHLSLSSRQGYLFTTFFREALMITLAVNAAILPCLFFHFQTFPLLSLLYNLFFPFLVSLSLFLLLLSLLLFFLFPPLAAPLFFLTDFLTSQILDLSTYPPLFLDYSIHCDFVPSWAIPIYLFTLFCISLLTNTSKIDYNMNHLHGDRSSVG